MATDAVIAGLGPTIRARVSRRGERNKTRMTRRALWARVSIKLDISCLLRDVLLMVDW